MPQAGTQHNTADRRAELPIISIIQGADGPHVLYADQDDQLLVRRQFPSFLAALSAARAVLENLQTTDGLWLVVVDGVNLPKAIDPERATVTESRLLRRGQFAALLDVSTRTVERWCAEGRVKPVLVTPGGQRRFSLEQVEQVREARWRGSWRIGAEDRKSVTPTAEDFRFVREVLFRRRMRELFKLPAEELKARARERLKRNGGS